MIRVQFFGAADTVSDWLKQHSRTAKLPANIARIVVIKKTRPVIRDFALKMEKCEYLSNLTDHHHAATEQSILILHPF
jgi:isopropylmalate/homocitrate/citramalate synthase